MNMSQSIINLFLLLIIILIIGALWRLPVFAPGSLNWDEVSLGYNAYSLAQTGHDEWGVVLPNIFRAFVNRLYTS
jgi:hypothetical protein